MIEYIKKLLSNGYIYLGLLFFVDDVISFIFNKNISLSDNFKYIILILIVLYATYKAWKDERDEKLRLYLIVNGEVQNLSVEAEELLREATQDESRTITKSKLLASYGSIGTNKKSFAQDALGELIEYNLIDKVNEDNFRISYKINKKGYKYIEERDNQ